MIKKIGILALVATLVASMTVASVMACTTRTPGYWKNHPEAWPAMDANLKAACLEILKTSPKGGDAWIILAQKVIAAKLSMSTDPGGHWADPNNFGGTYAFSAVVDYAADWLDDNPPPVLPGNPNRALALAIANWIDYWLNYYDLD